MIPFCCLLNIKPYAELTPEVVSSHKLLGLGGGLERPYHVRPPFEDFAITWLRYEYVYSGEDARPGA